MLYKTPYSKVPGGNITQIDTFLNSLDLPTLNEDQNRALTADITEDELTAAIRRLKLSKSPGSDGYTAEWYKEFKKEHLFYTKLGFKKGTNAPQLERGNNFSNTKRRQR